MGLPNTASRTLYRVREAEVPILSAAITVMKKISFRSILLRPSYCARPIRSPDFKPLCYRWDRPILWATLTVETKRKPSRILIRKFGESHQKPCSGSRTPKRCLSMLSFSPQLFADVGLLVFDECHLLHPRDLDTSRRSVDAMLCLLNLTT